MIIREPEIKPSVKYWVRPDIENRIKEGAIKAYFNSEVVEIRKTEIDVKTPDGLVTLENDFVLAMTGYLPNFDFLERLGITFSDDEFQTPDYNPETFESNRKGVYMAGVVCGGLNTSRWFIENAHDHAVRVFDHLTAWKK